MQILVTGGAGFIGSHLVDRLVADGHQVTVLDDLSTGARKNLPTEVSLIEGDVADAALVQSLVADAEIVFHLAAVASVAAYAEDVARCRRTNLTGTVTVLHAASAKKIPVIYASSAAVYGDNPQLPLAENALPKPISDYGADKLGCEVAAITAWEKHGVPSVGLRFFNVYGPRQDAASPYSGVISKFVANAKTGKLLTFFGDGEQTRDFIYVGDVVTLLMRAMTLRGDATVLNGCTGEAVSLKHLAVTIGAVLGKAIATQHAEARADDIRHSLGDPSKAKAAVGFTAETNLGQGLAALVASDA